MPLLIEIESDDAEEFVQAVDAAVRTTLVELRPEAVHLVRVKNWFDSKWLWFSGMGTAPARGSSPEPLATERKEYRQTEVTFPPFTPGRVLSEVLWLRGETSYTRSLDFPPIHDKERHPSAKNLQRRIRYERDSALYLWYSSKSRSNGQGSVMAYSVAEDRIVGWYLGLVQRSGHWAVGKVSGSIDPELRSAVSAVLEG